MALKYIKSLHPIIFPSAWIFCKSRGSQPLLIRYDCNRTTNFQARGFSPRGFLPTYLFIIRHQIFTKKLPGWDGTISMSLLYDIVCMVGNSFGHSCLAFVHVHPSLTLFPRFAHQSSLIATPNFVWSCDENLWEVKLNHERVKLI